MDIATSAANPERRSKGNSKVIDALRGLASLGVVMYHGYIWLLAPWGPNAFDGQAGALLEHVGRPYGAYWAAPLYPVLGLGFLGVNLFFVISGFCIHLPHARARIVSIDTPRFLLRRLVRLYPLYISVTIVLFLLYGPVLHQGTEKGTHLENFIGHVFFWHYFGPAKASGMGISLVMWTIALEVEFYCLYAFLFRFIRASNLTSLALTWTLVDFGYHLFAPWLGAHHVLHPVFSAARFAPTRFGEWLLGAAVAQRYVDRQLFRAPPLSIIGGFLLIILAVLLGSYLGANKYTATDVPGCLGFMLILSGLLSLECQGRLDPPNLTKWLGDRSYSLYLIHATIVLVVARLLTDRPYVGAAAEFASVAAFGVAISAAIVFAAIAYKFIEAPSHRLARQIRERRTLVATESI